MTINILASFELENTSPFDAIRLTDEQGNEYWLATQLLALLGYQTWKRIKDVVEKAKISAKNSGLDESHHLVNVVQMAQIGASQAFRETLKDFKLSRHACYLVTMNGNPRKPEIASAQNYFATKTREAEHADLQSQELLSQILQRMNVQNQVIEEQGRMIAVLQSQIQNLLPISSDFMPPGWDVDVWDLLPPQDKRHFRFIARRRHFYPSNQGMDSDSIADLHLQADQIRQKQQDELQALIGETSETKKSLLEAYSQEAEMLLYIASKGGEDNASY